MLKFDVLGTKELKTAIEKAEKKLVEGVDMALEASAYHINTQQKILAPKDFNRLGSGNDVDVTKPLYKVLENKIKYAPYQEFGTGAYVFMNEPWVDAELKEIASHFKGGNKRKVNIRPQPFFYKPFFDEKPRLIKAIEDILK